MFGRSGAGTESDDDSVTERLGVIGGNGVVSVVGEGDRQGVLGASPDGHAVGQRRQVG